VASKFNARNADTYEQLMGRWSRRLAPELIAFSGFRPGENIVDVGCGTGSLTFALITAGAGSVQGIDFSQTYVDFALARINGQPVMVQQGDAGAMPYHAGEFDRALCQLVLQFVPDAGAVVAEMRRVVRPGGTVTAAVWDHFGGYAVQRMLWDTAAVLDPAADACRGEMLAVPVSRPGGMGALWREHGLADVEESAITIRMEYAVFDDFWAPIAAGEGRIGSYVAGLASDPRATLEHHVRRAYLGQQPDGPRSFAALALVCRGTVPG